MISRHFLGPKNFFVLLFMVILIHIEDLSKIINKVLRQINALTVTATVKAIYC